MRIFHKFRPDSLLVLLALSNGSILFLLQPGQTSIRLLVAAGLLLLIGVASAMGRRESGMREIIDATSAALVLIDKMGLIVRVNKAAQKTFGYKRDEMVGQSVEMLVPESRRVDHVGHRSRFTAAPRARSMTWQQDMFGRRKTGGEFPVAVELHPLHMGDECLVLGTIFDLTEVQQLRQQSEDAKVVAEIATRAKSTFLANMSHEIRTPMSGVLGMLELLLDTELSPGQRETAETAHLSADSLLVILNNILDLSKIDAGEIVLEDIPFDLTKTVAAAVKILGAAAADRGNEIHLDMGSEVPETVRGDPGRLRQIITNLVSNALKFTENGEVAVAVTLVSERDGNARIRFAVRDTGIGIAADKQRLIFQEFGQADASVTRTHGGTGLGLTISERLVSRMGGRLKVSSQLGKGSEFWFEVALPVTQRRMGAWKRRASMSLLGRRFLVVDDSATARRIVREAAESVGASCDQADSTSAGLELLRRSIGLSRHYDAVIIDAVMPERDGFELATEIRRDPELMGTRMIMITSSMDPQGPQKARAAGITGYLNKPVARVDLVFALQTLLGLRGCDEGEERRLITENSLLAEREPLTILVAEDNPVNQQIASAMLRKRGHTVFVAANGREAVKMVQSHDFDIVLMDVQMPEMDGLTATRKIHALDGYADLPIVALTAHALVEERERCRDAGMTGFLTKPFKGQQLLSLVENTARPSMHRSTDDRHIAVQDGTASPPVNLNAFRESMREVGIEEVVDTILATFCAEMPERINALKLAANANDMGAIAGTAHAMKSAAGAIHAVALANGMDRLEDAANQGDTKATRRLVQEAYRKIDDTMAFLDNSGGGNS